MFLTRTVTAEIFSIDGAMSQQFTARRAPDFRPSIALEVGAGRKPELLPPLAKITQEST